MQNIKLLDLNEIYVHIQFIFNIIGIYFYLLVIIMIYLFNCIFKIEIVDKIRTRNHVSLIYKFIIII